MPFDELYHKEKSLIDNVIRASKRLEEKEKTLPHPYFTGRAFKIRDVQDEFNEHLLNP